MPEPSPTDPALEDVADHLYVIFCDKLPYCGCGTPDAGYRLIHQILTLAPLYEDQRWQQVEALCGTPGAHQLVLAALNDADLLEHGSVISGSWLTDRGRWVLWAIEQIGGIDALEAVIDGPAGYPHDAEGCTDACFTIPAEAKPAP
ncbi:MAG: hypothetical protein HOW97_12295 [Catenulispora sp.]|nr:hypothetical protein [Catenulispora sp.]